MNTDASFDFLDPIIPVLEFRLAHFDPKSTYDVGFDRVNFTLRKGELMLVRHDPKLGRLGLADAAQGLFSPSSGEVLFEGKNWGQMSARASESARGKIGRVFVENSWISNLDVEENVLLRLKHGWFMSKRKVQQQLKETCAHFGVRELPHVRPSMMPVDQLQMAQWIRAFVGAPRLVLLEHLVNDASLPRRKLIEAVDDVLKREGAVVWITDREDIWSGADVKADQRFVVTDDTMRAFSEDA